MELFLNLCWLSLLLPAYVLWQRRVALSPSPVSGRRLSGHPLVLIGALGCALILLFPVISATDDLHAMRPESEESERAIRDANRCASANHAPTHFSQPVPPRSASLTAAFEQVGTVLPFVPQMRATFSAAAPAGRAPPFETSTSL